MSRLRGLERRLLLAQVARRLLRLLHRSRALAYEILVACVFLLREGQRGLRLACLLGGLLDPGLLLLELGIRVGDAGLRLLDLGLRLVDGGAIVAIIDARENRAGLDELIVRDGTSTIAPATSALTAIGRPSMKASSVVSIMARVEPPYQRADQRRYYEDGGKADRERVAADQVADAASALRDGVVGVAPRDFRAVLLSLVVGYAIGRVALRGESFLAAIPAPFPDGRFDAFRTLVLADAAARVRLSRTFLFHIGLSCSRPRSQSTSIRGDHAREQGDSDMFLHCPRKSNRLAARWFRGTRAALGDALSLAACK